MRWALVVLCLASLGRGQDSRAARAAAMETITAADLERHLRVIADDAMRGRSTPSAGLAATARYLAEQFEKAGAKPGAAGGRWFQVKKTPIVAFDLAGASVAFDVDGVAVPVGLGTSAGMTVRGQRTVALDRARVVPVEPEALRREAADDLAASSSEIKGSMLLVPLASWPGPGDPLDHFTARAEAVGAAGCILVSSGWKEPEGLRDYRQAGLEAQRVRREGRSPRPTTVGIEVHEPSLVEHLLARVTAEKENRRGDSRPAVLRGVTLSVALRATEADADVSNVVATVPAAPGPLSGEAVVFTAHYDHIGIAPPVDGDWIRNGADDDGSGAVALLELAEAYARLRPAPARKLVFVAFFGEERGGLGSRFYASDPAHPMDKTVCDVNIEMIGRTWKIGPKVAWVTGWDFSTLGAILAEGGAEVGVKIVPDPYPEQNFFLRSDNVAFVKAKVPGHSVSAGSTHEDYHGLNDEVDRIEFGNMEHLVRAIFLGTSRIADGTRDVRWTREIPRVP
jgi:hypothetical protein